MKYTYLIDHGDNAPSVGAGLDIQGGELVAVQFSDALDECDRLRTALDNITSWVENMGEFDMDDPVWTATVREAREALKWREVP